MAGSIGYATLPVIPSIRNIGPNLAAQITAPMAAAGTQAGQKAGSNIVSAITSKVATVGKIVGGAVLAAGAALGGVAITKGLGRLLNIEDAQAKLKGLGHDARNISVIMGSALDSVRGTAFGLDEAATVAASAVAAGIKPGQDLTRYLKLTADAAVIAGTSMGEMGSIINKVTTSGKVYTDNLNQLADRGIPIFQWLQKEYGVTADELSEMVTKGEVDAATFQKVIEENIGGSALSAGNTTRGALANIGAALGRVGAMFLSGGVQAAPGLFQSISGAIDRSQVALQPYADALTARVVPALGAVAAWIDGIDFNRIVGGVREFYLGAVDVKDLLLTGFTENETLLPPGVVQGLQVAHDVIASVAAGVRGLFASFQSGGDLSGVGEQFSSIGASVTTLQPALQSFVSALPNIGGAVATLAAAGLNVLVQVLSFLADNVDTIIAFMPAIVAGFFLWKGATALVYAQSASLATLQLRMLPLTTANTFARLAAARAELQLAAATGTSTAAQNGGFFATARATAATVAQKAAMVASRGAMLVATAAQWAWNAAMSANPIGIIILAIAALVAGLVWFFTQTELGREVWANVTAAIGAAVTWLWESVISPVFNFIGGIFKWLWETIISPIVTFVVNYFRLWGAIAMWLWNNVVSPVFQQIGAIFTWIWNTIISPIVTLVVNYFRLWGAIAMWLWNNVISPVFQAIGAVFAWIWNSVISPVIGWIVERVNLFGLGMQLLYSMYVKPAFDAIGAVFRWLWENIVMPVFNGISSTISDTWSWIDTNVFTPFKNGIGLLGDAFENIASAIGTQWDKIKKAAADPINFVLDTVWNKGLRSFWNDLVDELGLDDMKLPKADLVKFANGSENHVAQIAGAGSMRLWAEPETGGEAYIPLAGSKRGRSTAILQNVAKRFGYGLQPFADGGFWGGAADLAGDVWDNVTKAASVAWDFVSDPAGAIQSHVVDGILKPLLAGGPGGIFADTIGQLPIRLVKNLSGMFADAAPKSGGTAGMGWEAMWARVQEGIPGVSKTSDYRPGAKTVNGGQSYHSSGRAIDLIPAAMSTFNAVAKMFPNASELIYSPAGARQLRNGQPFNGWSDAVRRQHYNHVHLAMADGGILPRLGLGGNIRPTAGGTPIIAGEAGRAETVTDLGRTNRLINVAVALAEKAVRTGGGDRIIQVENLGYDPDDLFDAWERNDREEALLAGLSGGAA